MTDAASDPEFPRLEPDDDANQAAGGAGGEQAPTGQVPPPADAPPPPAAEAAPSPSGDPQGWPAGKADTTKRIVAVVIDAGLAIVVGMIPFVGGIIATAYWVLRDGMDLEFMDHRSVGKKLTKLRPVKADGSQLEMMDSVNRNWMFGLGGVIQILLFIPILGWLLMVPVGLAAMAFGLVELFKVLTDDEGRRFGDVWAQTKVIEVDS